MGTMRNTLIAVCLVVSLGASSAPPGVSNTSARARSAHRRAALPPCSAAGHRRNIVPSASSCSDFKWDVTQQTGNTRQRNVQRHVRRGPQGRRHGAWNVERVGRDVERAQATASAPGLPSCAINLTGTAELGVDSIRVPYSGDTCLGKVSGVENLKKR